MSWPTAPWGPGATMNSSAVAPCAANACGDRRLDPLDRQRLAVDLEAVPVRDRMPQQVARGVHPRLGGPLRAPDAGQLGVRLHPPAIVEEVAVDRQLDAVGAQPVGEPERERLRHDGARHAEALDRARRDLIAELLVGEARCDQLVRRRTPRMDAARWSPSAASRGISIELIGDVPDPAHLGVQERVGNRRAAPRGAAPASETCRR